MLVTIGKRADTRVPSPSWPNLEILCLWKISCNTRAFARYLLLGPTFTQRQHRTSTCHRCSFLVFFVFFVFFSVHFFCIILNSFFVVVASAEIVSGQRGTLLLLDKKFVCKILFSYTPKVGVFSSPHTAAQLPLSLCFLSFVRT